MDYNLARPFYECSRVQPERCALYVNGREYSYAELADLASRTAAALGPAQKVGVLASRTLSAYAGVLGAAWSGAAYIPLNPKLPAERLARIFEIVGLDALIVDEHGAACLNPTLLESAPRLILDLGRNLDVLPASRLDEPHRRGPNDLAYVIFTSGTTGVPKGVMIECKSVACLLDAMRQRCLLVPNDRVSQTSEITFDVSVFEMFGPWAAGASVHVIPPNQLMAPGRFISEQDLTIWSSVPSIAAMMKRMKMLKPGAFPSLRYSGFIGEPLPQALAEAWQNAAPNGVVENLYGPTEATVYCTGATVRPGLLPTPGRDTLPIGTAFPQVEAAIVDDSLAFLPRGREGQLALSGEQLARGYYGEPELTGRRFPTIEGTTWYLTGDLAMQDQAGVFHHLGRVDHQVKILGQRVELEDIEAHLRTVSQSEHVAAVAWPIEDGRASGVVAFISGALQSATTVREALKEKLPPYMVPRRIIEMESLPLGSTGKIDRRALSRHLEGLAAGEQAAT